MSEPSRTAARVERVAPGILHWTVPDDRIGFRSDAYAVEGDGGTVLVDPLPLSERALASLGAVSAIVLTIQSHQRSAWRYRARFGAKVHAPAGAEGLEEEPDAWYEDEAALPGGLRALHAPGPCDASYALLLGGGRRAPVAFVGDLVTREGSRALAFVPDRYQDAPRATRESVRRLAEERIAVLCPGHGAPLRKGGRAALAAALARDRGG
ncbi:MAG TPA: MBL fold metallo-hydrolase [Anaeromyxobacter sp.]